MVVDSNCSPLAPHPTQRPQTNQPTSQPPTTVPTTGWRPPLLRPQTTLLPGQPPRPLPPVILMPCTHTIWPRAPPPTSPQTLLFLPPVAPSVTPHDLQLHRYNMVPTHTPTATPCFNYTKPDNDHHNRPAIKSSTPPWQSIRLINTCLPGNIANTGWPSNILLQAMHHVMQLEATNWQPSHSGQDPSLTSKKSASESSIPSPNKPSHNIGNSNMTLTLKTSGCQQ